MKTTGSVQEKNGRFYFVLNLYDANGKRKIKWISTGLTVRGNKRKAEAMLHEVLLRYRKLFKKSYSAEYLDFVCTDQEGKLIRPNFVTEHFDWLLTKYGLKHIRFHDLRHSCASLMVMNGVSMKQVQEWLGHSTFSTTADIYAHLDYKSKQGSAGVIANLLGESKFPK